MSKDTVTLLATGDIGSEVEPVDRLADLIVPVLKQADLRFAQCERTYSERVTSSREAYRRLSPQLASVWKKAEIDIISMASNHTMDWGPEVMMDTIELFRAMGKHTIGAGKDENDARKPVIVEHSGVKIAFLGYCSVLQEGHEAGPGKAGCAPMRIDTYYQRGKDQDEEHQPGEPPAILTTPWEKDLQALLEDIRKAKERADAVVMSMHWGLHHVPKTIADYQPVIAHAAIDAGADIILGHHPHILKAVEVYKGKVCFYSLGNFMKTRSHLPATTGIWNNLWWYRVDPAYMPPHSIYNYHPDQCKTMIAKVLFTKKGVERVSFLPALINPLAQPAVIPASDPKFQEILDYVEWISDQYPHKFRVDGNEVVVDTST